MINALTFLSLLAIACWSAVWLSYRIGHDAGWLAGWEDRRFLSQKGVVDSESRRDI